MWHFSSLPHHIYIGGLRTNSIFLLIIASLHYQYETKDLHQLHVFLINMSSCDLLGIKVKSKTVHMHACSSFTCKVRQLQYRCAPPRGQPEVPGDISLHPGSTFSSAAHFPAPANQELPQVHTPSHGTKIFCSSEEGFPDTSQDDRDQWFEK